MEKGSLVEPNGGSVQLGLQPHRDSFGLYRIFHFHCNNTNLGVGFLHSISCLSLFISFYFIILFILQYITLLVMEYVL